jgi:hypothetical protein
MQDNYRGSICTRPCMWRCSACVARLYYNQYLKNNYHNFSKVNSRDLIFFPFLAVSWRGRSAVGGMVGLLGGSFQAWMVGQLGKLARLSLFYSSRLTDMANMATRRRTHTPLSATGRTWWWREWRVRTTTIGRPGRWRRSRGAELGARPCHGARGRDDARISMVAHSHGRKTLLVCRVRRIELTIHRRPAGWHIQVGE